MGRQLQPMDISAPGQNLESYLSSIQNIAILTPEQEKKLAEDLYYNDDLEAARQLVMAHLRFVVHIARGYAGYGLPQADLIQEGNVGLMKAVKKFNQFKQFGKKDFFSWIQKRLLKLYEAKNERVRPIKKRIKG